MTQEHVLNLIHALVVDHMTSVAKSRDWDRVISQTDGKAQKAVEVALDRLCKAVRDKALTDALQAAQPDDAFQDEWFKAKADACRRIELLKDKP